MHLSAAAACRQLRDALFDQRLPNGVRAFRFVFVECLKDGDLTVHTDDRSLAWERQGIETPDGFGWSLVRASTPEGWTVDSFCRHKPRTEWPFPWTETAKEDIDAFPTLVLFEHEDGQVDGALMRDPHTHENTEANLAEAHPEPDDARSLVNRLCNMDPGERLERMGWYKESNIPCSTLDSALASVRATSGGQKAIFLYRTNEWLTGQWNDPKSGNSTLLRLSSVADFHGSRVSSSKRQSRPGLEQVRAANPVQADWSALLDAVQKLGKGPPHWRGPGHFETHPAVQTLCAWWNAHAPEAFRSAAVFRVYVWSEAERQFHAGDPEEPAALADAFLTGENRALFEQEGLPSVVVEFSRGYADQITGPSGGFQIVNVDGTPGYSFFCSPHEYDESLYSVKGLRSLRQVVATWRRSQPVVNPPHPVFLPPSWGFELGPESMGKRLTTLARAPNRFKKELWVLLEAARLCDLQLRGPKGRGALHAVLLNWGDIEGNKKSHPFPAADQLARLPLPGDAPWDGTGSAEGWELPAATLIQRGADPFQADNQGVRPWDLALSCKGTRAVLLQMVRAGGPHWSQHLTTDNWVTLVEQHRFELIDFLVSLGARTTARIGRKQDRTLLYHLSGRGITKQPYQRYPTQQNVGQTVRALVGAGVDPLHTDRRGQTALEYEGASPYVPGSEDAWAGALALAQNGDQHRADLAVRSAVFVGSMVALQSLEQVLDPDAFQRALCASTPAGSLWNWLLLGSMCHPSHSGFSGVAERLRREPSLILSTENVLWACTMNRRVWLGEHKDPSVTEVEWETAWKHLRKQALRWTGTQTSALMLWNARATSTLATSLLNVLQNCAAHRTPALEAHSEEASDEVEFSRWHTRCETVNALAFSDAQRVFADAPPEGRAAYALLYAEAVVRLVEEPQGFQSNYWRQHSRTYGGNDHRPASVLLFLFKRLMEVLGLFVHKASPEERMTLCSQWPSVGTPSAKEDEEFQRTEGVAAYRELLEQRRRWNELTKTVVGSR